jgi:hypothetical protein
MVLVNSGRVGSCHIHSMALSTSVGRAFLCL